MTQRLPIPGSDDGSWGDILNGFLEVSHNSDGSLSTSAVTTALPSTINANISGNAATVTTNANLTGPITSTGNTTAVASQTGTGSTFAMSVSPAFTGSPTAPTPATSDNSTNLATTAYVQAQGYPQSGSYVPTSQLDPTPIILPLTLSGSAPSATQGLNGDYVLDLSTSNMWGPKTAGSWPGSPVAELGSAGAVATAGTPVIRNDYSGTAVSSYTLSMSGVVSGQPIIVVNFAGAVLTGTPITDTFATPYTWTKIEGYLQLSFLSCDVWVGTGGVGTSGVITVTQASSQICSGAAIPLINASINSGTGVVDVQSGNQWFNASNSTTIDTTSSGGNLAPSTSGEIIIVAARAFSALTAWANSPWVVSKPEISAQATCVVATLSNPSPGYATPEPASGTSTPKGVVGTFTIGVSTTWMGVQVIIKRLGN